MKFQNWKIVNQLALLVFISIAGIIMILFINYMGIKKISQKQIKSYSDSALYQIATDLDNECKNIISSVQLFAYDTNMQAYFETEDDRKRMDLYVFVNKLAGIVGTSHRSIIDLSIIENGGGLLTTTYTYSQTEEFKFKYKYLYFEDLQEKYRFFDNSFIKYVVTPYRSMAGNEGVYSIIFPIFRTNANRMIDMSGKAAVCIITLNTNLLKDKIKVTKYIEGSNILIIDSDNTVVEAQDADLIGKPFSLQKNKIDNFREVVYEGKKSYVNSQQIPTMNWTVVEIIPASINTRILDNIRILGFSVTATATILLITLVWFINRNIRNPIKKIISFTKEVKNDYYDKRIEINEQNEIGVLSTYINDMLTKIQHMNSDMIDTQAKLYETEINQKNAVLNSLQNKINPHFLYNTLECIRSIALTNDVDEIVTITTAMAKIFRYTIKGRMVVSIRDEIDSILDYLSIVDIRYGGRISYSVEIEPDLYEYLTLKMILQPIIENSIYHGLELKKGKGMLKISGYREEEAVIFKIEDNGLGIPEENLCEIRNMLENSEADKKKSQELVHGMGLSNINERIKLYLGEEYGIAIQSICGEGTVVTVRIAINVTEII